MVSVHPETDVSGWTPLAIGIQLSAKGIKNKKLADPAKSGTVCWKLHSESLAFSRWHPFQFRKYLGNERSVADQGYKCVKADFRIRCLVNCLENSGYHLEKINDASVLCPFGLYPKPSDKSRLKYNILDLILLKTQYMYIKKVF